MHTLTNDRPVNKQDTVLTAMYNYLIEKKQVQARKKVNNFDTSSFHPTKVPVITHKYLAHVKHTT
jgi:hypothetical protein